MTNDNTIFPQQSRDLYINKKITKLNINNYLHSNFGKIESITLKKKYPGNRKVTYLEGIFLKFVGIIHDI